MRGHLFQLCMLLWLAGQLRMDALPAQATPKNQPQNRVELFVGNGSVNWLPQSNLLPSAKEIDNRAQKLGARQRNMGPFGLRMFPVEDEAAPAAIHIARGADRVTLNQALQTLRINGINLDRREFLIGARNVFEGDALEVFFKGEVFVAEVVEIAPMQIVFRDHARRETGVLAHNLVQHLALEPIRNRPSGGALEGKLSPMEPIKNQRP